MDGGAWERRRDGDIFDGIDRREQAYSVRGNKGMPVPVLLGGKPFQGVTLPVIRRLDAAMESVLHIFQKTVGRS